MGYQPQTATEKTVVGLNQPSFVNVNIASEMYLPVAPCVFLVMIKLSSTSNTLHKSAKLLNFNLHAS